MKISKLRGKAARKTYKLLISDEIIPCDIKIVDGEEAYYLQINIEDVMKFANAFEYSIENYTKILFQILLGEIEASFVHVDDKSVTFNKTKSLKFFSKEAQKVNYAETMQILAEHLYQEKCTQNEEIIKLKKNNNNLQDEVIKTQEKLDNVIENANKHEEQLYACFIQTLNEKKKYIQLLKFHIDKKGLKQIENLRESKRKAQISDSETDAEEYNTDDESVVNIPRKQSRHHTGASTSTSKSEVSPNDADGLSSNLLLDSDSDDALFCTALPPRVTDVNTHNDEVSKGMGEKQVQEETEEVKTEMETNGSQKSLADNKCVNEERMDTEMPTPVIAYSTQDLLDDI